MSMYGEIRGWPECSMNSQRIWRRRNQCNEIETAKAQSKLYQRFAGGENSTPWISAMIGGNLIQGKCARRFVGGNMTVRSRGKPMSVQIRVEFWRQRILVVNSCLYLKAAISHCKVELSLVGGEIPMWIRDEIWRRWDLACGQISLRIHSNIRNLLNVCSH